MRTKLLDEVWTTNAAQTLFDATTLLRLIPEEILPLGEFFFLTFRREDRLERIGVVAGVPSLGGNGHRGWRKVLYLFEVEVETLGDDSEFGHILFLTAWVAGDEVGDDLLVQAVLLVDLVEYPHKEFEKGERWLPHHVQHIVRGVFWCHLKTARNMFRNQLFCIFFVALVYLLVLFLV